MTPTRRALALVTLCGALMTGCGGGGGSAIIAALSIVTNALPIAQLNQFYETLLEADGGQGTLNWSLISGELPAGVAFVPAEAKIVGTPTLGGDFEVVFQVRDSNGQQQQVRLALQVNRSPEIVVPPFAFLTGANGQIQPVTMVNSGDTVFLRVQYKEEDVLNTTTVLWEQIVPLTPLGTFANALITPLVDNEGNPSATDRIAQIEWTAPPGIPADTDFILRVSITDDAGGVTDDSVTLLVKFVPPINGPPALTDQDWEDEQGVVKSVDIYEPTPFNAADIGDAGAGGVFDNNFLLLAAEFTDPESETITLVSWVSDDLSTSTPDDGPVLVSPDTDPIDGTVVGSLTCSRTTGTFCARFRPPILDLTAPRQYEIRVKVRDIQNNETQTTWLVNVNDSIAGTPPPPNNPPVVGTSPADGAIVVGQTPGDKDNLSVSASDPDGDTLRYWWFVDDPTFLPPAPDCDGATGNWDFVPGAAGTTGNNSEVVSPDFMATAALVDPGGSGTCVVPVTVSVGDQKASGIVEQGGGASATTVEDAEGTFVTDGVCDIDGVIGRPECDYGWFLWNISETPYEFAQIKTVVSDTEITLDGAGIVSMMNAGESYRILACDLGNLVTPGDPSDDCPTSPTTPADITVTLAPVAPNLPPNITQSPQMSPSAVVETLDASVSAQAEDLDGPLPLAYWWRAWETADGTMAPKGVFADPLANATTWTAPLVAPPVVNAGSHTLEIDVASVQVAGVGTPGSAGTVLTDALQDFDTNGTMVGWVVRRTFPTIASGVVTATGTSGCFGVTTVCVGGGLLDPTGAPAPPFAVGDVYEIFNCDLGDLATPGVGADVCSVTTDPGESQSVNFTLIENTPPVADIAFTILDPDPFNLLVQFDGSLSVDPDTSPDPITYMWDFDYVDDTLPPGLGPEDFDVERTTSSPVTNFTFTANDPSYQVGLMVSDGLAFDDDIDFALVVPNQGPVVPQILAYDQALQSDGVYDIADVLGPPPAALPTGSTVGFAAAICDDDALDIVEWDFNYDGVAFTVDAAEDASGAVAVAGTGLFPGGNGCEVGVNRYDWEANSTLADGLNGGGLAFPFAGDYRVAVRVTDAEGARSLPFCLDVDPPSAVFLESTVCPEGVPKDPLENPVTIGLDHLISDFLPPDGNADTLSPGQHDLETPDGTEFHMVWSDNRSCGGGAGQSQIFYSTNPDVGLDPSAWTASVNITDGATGASCGAAAYSPDLVIDPADPTHLIVFFADERSGDADIWWVESSDSGATWSPFANVVPTTVLGSGPGPQLRPSLSIDDAGGTYDGFWHLHFEDTEPGTARQVHALFDPVVGHPAGWGLSSSRVNSPPMALLTIDGDTIGPAPFTPMLYAEGNPSTPPLEDWDSYDPEGGALTYEWDFDWTPLGDCAADPFADALGASVSPGFGAPGFHYVGLRATDDVGLIDCAGMWLTVEVGNLPPEPTYRLCAPGTGGLVDPPGPPGPEPVCRALGELDAPAGTFTIDAECQWPDATDTLVGTYDPDFGDDPDVPDLDNVECHWDWDWDGTSGGFSADDTSACDGSSVCGTSHDYTAAEIGAFAEPHKVLVGMQACDLGDVDAPGPSCAPVIGTHLYVDDYDNHAPVAIIGTGFNPPGPPNCTDTEAAGALDLGTGEFIICLDGRLSYDHEEGDVASYTWDCDLGAISGSDVLVDNADGTATCTYDEEGDYTVELTVDDSEPLMDITTITVFVGDGPTPPSHAPRANFYNVPPVLEYDAPAAAGTATATYDCRASVDPDGEIATCDWSFGGLYPPVPATDVLVHVWDFPTAAPGIHGVTLTVTDNNGDTDVFLLGQEVLPYTPRGPNAAIIVDDPSGLVPLVPNFDSVAVDPDDATDLVNDDCAGCTYAWDFNVGGFCGVPPVPAVFAGTTPGAVTFPAECDYPVSLTVTDTDALVDVVTTTITVEHLVDNRAPRAFFSFDPSTPAWGTLDSTSGEMTVTLDGRWSDDIDGTVPLGTYSWDCDAGAISGSEVLTDFGDGTASCLFDTPGAYTVTLDVDDNDGLAAPTFSQTVYVRTYNQEPQAAVKSVAYTYFGAPVAVPLDASDSFDLDGTIVSYDWECDGDGFFDEGTTAIPSFVCPAVGAGTIDLGVEVCDDDGDCEDAEIEIVVDGAPVTQAPQPLITHSVAQIHEMVTNAVFLDASPLTFDPDSGTFEYDYDCGNGSGTLPGDFDNSFITCTYGAAGTYTVTLDVCDDPGPDDVDYGTGGACAPGNETTVDVTFFVEANRPPVAMSSIDLFSEWAGETTHAATFNDTEPLTPGSGSYDPDGDPITHTWTCPGGGIAAPAGFSNTCTWPTPPGNYVALLTVTDDEGFINLDTHNEVRVTNASPMPVVVLDPDSEVDLRGVQDHFVELNATFPTALSQDPEAQALTYSWDCGNATFPVGPFVTCAYTAPGTYTATVTATDPHGAFGTASVPGISVSANRPPRAVISGPDDFDITTEDHMAWVGDVDHSVFLSAHNSSDADGQPVDGWVWDCDDAGAGIPGVDHVLTDFLDGTAVCEYFTPGYWDISLTVFDPPPYLASSTHVVTVRVVDHAPQVAFYQRAFGGGDGQDPDPNFLDILATGSTNFDVFRTVELNDQLMRWEVDCHYTDEVTFGGDGSGGAPTPVDFNVDYFGSELFPGSFGSILDACGPEALDSSNWPNPETDPSVESDYRGDRNVAVRACAGSTTAAPIACTGAPDREFTTVLWRNRFPISHLGMAAGTVPSGPAPHSGTFDASASWDPDADPLLAADAAVTPPQWRCDDTGSPPFTGFGTEAWPYDDSASLWTPLGPLGAPEMGLSVTGAAAGDTTGDTNGCTVSFEGVATRPSVYVRDGNPGDEGWGLESCLEANDYDGDLVFDPVSSVFEAYHCANFDVPAGSPTPGGFGTDAGRDNPPQVVFRLDGATPDLFGITPFDLGLETTVYDPDAGDLVDSSAMSASGYEIDWMFSRSRLWGGNEDPVLDRHDFNLNDIQGPAPLLTLESGGIWRVAMKASTNGTNVAQLTATQTAAANGDLINPFGGEDPFSQPLCKEENSINFPGNTAAIFRVSDVDATLFSVGEFVTVFDTDVEDPTGDGDNVPPGDFIPGSGLGETDGSINARICDMVDEGGPNTIIYLDGFGTAPESYDFPSARIQQTGVQKNEADINSLWVTTDGYLGNVQYQGAVPGSGSGAAIPDYHAQHRWVGTTPLGYAAPAQVGSDDRFASAKTSVAEAPTQGIFTVAFDSLPPLNPVHRVQFVRSVYQPPVGAGDTGLGWFDFNFEDQLDVTALDSFGFSDLAGGTCNNGELCRNARSLNAGIRPSLEDESSDADSGTGMHVAFFNSDNTQIMTSADLGRTWPATPTTINEIAGTVSSTFPATSLALDMDGGGPLILAHAWADTRDGTERIYFACTDDLSTVWPPLSTQIGDDVAFPTRQQRPNLAVVGMDLYVFWTDNRRGDTSQEIFFQTGTCVIP